MSSVRYHRALHVLAVLTTLATFPLIFMGGLVTSHQAGMSVPDWPNSYGYNMFLFPPRLWLGGIIYEHTHRLMGTLVGFCSIALVTAAFGWARDTGKRRLFGLGTLVFGVLGIGSLYRLYTMQHSGEFNPIQAKNFQHVAVGLASLALIFLVLWLCRHREDRAWIRRLCVIVLVAVIFQGALGGIRVIGVNLDLAIVHACVAQAFFCLAAFTALVTSRWWIADTDKNVCATDGSCCSPIVKIGLVALLIVYAQLIVGATMRHYAAGLAAPDLPLMYGHWTPPTDARGLEAVNQQLKEWKLNDDELRLALPRPVTMVQLWLHFGHRLGSILVSIAVVTLGIVTMKRADSRFLRTLAGILFLLILTQFTLGVLVIWYRKAADIASLHVAGGALTLLTTFLITAAASHRTRSLASSRVGFIPTIAQGGVEPHPARNSEVRPA